MNATANDLNGTYYPAAPGARTLRDARDLYINRQRVSATVTDRHATVFTGGEIVFDGQLPADITTGHEVNAWAAHTALAAAETPAPAPTFPGSVAAHLAATATTPDEHRETAAAYATARQESYDRCDTDGALSQWAYGLNEAKHHLAAQIAEQGGTWEFAGLFDLNGNPVPAVRVQGRYGWAWKLLDDNGRTTAWFNESKAKDDTRRTAAHARKGYYVGTVRVPAYADLAAGGIGCITPVALRKDGYSPDAEIVDNGQ
ncbi:hypothetical protein [Streptomyces sp. YIM S03343]